MFIDKVKITVKAGNGGDGIVSFLRMKGISTGGPNGGDGGDGGAVIIRGTSAKNSLLDFYYQKKYFAEDGARGENKDCHGKNAENLIIPVPLGTIVRDEETGNIICDVFYEGEEKIILNRGIGGKGNARFTTSRRHTPHFAQKGEKTEVKKLILELKTIADVGLIGFPNVGKSTLLSKISQARPKIANYHFTTLSPNLGVVKYYDDSFVVADIPGLIEGASSGAGLGFDFLRHIERTRILVHVIDVSGEEGRDPKQDFKKINNELKTYSEKLGNSPQIVVANKCDVAESKDNIKKLKTFLKNKYPVLCISALTGEGTKELLDEIFKTLKTLPALAPLEYTPYEYIKDDPDKFDILIDDEGVFIVTGPLVKMFERNISLDDMDSMALFQKMLRDKGVIKKLRKLGAKDGDIVSVGEVEFDFVE